MKDDCKKQDDSVGRRVARSLFAHILLRGGGGNPFQSMRSEWFVDMAAPKLQEIFDAFAEKIILAMLSTDLNGGPAPVIVAPKKNVFDFCEGCNFTEACAIRGGCVVEAIVEKFFTGRPQ